MGETFDHEYTAEQWYDFALQHYSIIKKEFENAFQNSEVADASYSKLVVSCTFFAFLRGEFFLTVRPGGLGEKQKEFYAWEDELFKKLEQLKAQVNHDSHVALIHKQELDFWFQK
jgi:hypothetical protein